MLRILLAGEVIYYLERGAWEELQRQTRLTCFFESEKLTMES
jgi:hypothetical protein